MKATSSRRQLIMAVLLALATVGAAMRYWADNPSLTRDIGTLLLVLWVPAVGNLIAFLVRKMPRKVPVVPDFEPGSAFVPHRRAELTPLAPLPPAISTDERRCALIIGKDAYTARLPQPLSEWLATGQPQTVELQFLRPEVALPKLPKDTVFHVLVGTTVIGRGLVVT